MDTIDTDGTVGGNVSKGGYGNHVYTVSMNLVLGSAGDQTFFDLKDSVIEMASGYTLTIYTHASRATFSRGLGVADVRQLDRCSGGLAQASRDGCLAALHTAAIRVGPEYGDLG